MNQKQWSLAAAVSVSTVLSLIAAVTVVMDPYKFFTHSHSYNNSQRYRDERLIKSNDFLRHGRDYNAVIIGSSTSAFINSRRFRDHKVFNFGVSAFKPKELKAWIDFILEINPNIERLYISFDFHHYLKSPDEAEAPDTYISKVTDPLFPLRMLLSFNALADSLQNYKIAQLIKREGPNAYLRRIYDRKGVASIGKRSQLDAQEKFRKFEPYHSGPEVDSDFARILSELKTYKVPMVILTAPITQQGLQYDYKIHGPAFRQWLRLLVDTFGEVHHFTYLHSFAKDPYENFYDHQHYYPHVGDHIVDHLDGIQSPIGVVLTPKNFDKIYEELLVLK